MLYIMALKGMVIKMEVYFKIGEVAEAFEISVRALHLYDKMQLFVPLHTDEKTGYRYYTADQMGKLATIISFKKLGFTLYEIKDLIDNNLNKEQLLKVLSKKIKYFEDQIASASFNIENINNIIASIENSSELLKREDLSDEEKALRMSHLVCLENIRLESTLSEVLWL